MFGDEIFHGGFAFVPCHDSNDTHGRTLSHGFCELVCILTSVSDFSFSTFGQVFCAPFMGKARWVIGWAMVGRAEFARGPQGYQADSNSMVTISLSVHFLTSS